MADSRGIDRMLVLLSEDKIVYCVQDCVLAQDCILAYKIVYSHKVSSVQSEDSSSLTDGRSFKCLRTFLQISLNNRQ